MDRNSACRLAVRIPVDNGRHDSSDLNLVRDKDTICWMDLYADLDFEIKRGMNQKFSVNFWDKIERKYNVIDSDSTLLAALAMYWDIRRLSLIVIVDNDPSSRPDCCVEPEVVADVQAETTTSIVPFQPTGTTDDAEAWVAEATQ